MRIMLSMGTLCRVGVVVLALGIIAGLLISRGF